MASNLRDDDKNWMNFFSYFLLLNLFVNRKKCFILFFKLFLTGSSVREHIQFIYSRREIYIFY